MFKKGKQFYKITVKFPISIMNIAIHISYTVAELDVIIFSSKDSFMYEHPKELMFKYSLFKEVHTTLPADYRTHQYPSTISRLKLTQDCYNPYQNISFHC